jgi:hypothetical protein
MLFLSAVFALVFFDMISDRTVEPKSVVSRAIVCCSTLLNTHPCSKAMLEPLACASIKLSIYVQSRSQSKTLTYYWSV